VVHHTDVVVNVGSTMAMDFAILDKPGIYLAYNPQGSDKNKGWNFTICIVSLTFAQFMSCNQCIGHMKQKT